MSQSTNATTAPAELSQGRKHAIFFTLIVKMVVNMQQVTKRFKALKTEFSKQKERIHGYVLDPKELLTEYAKILSDISGVPYDEMRLFIKEYVKDHLKKRLKPVDIETEAVEKIIYNASLQVSTVEGMNSLFNFQNSVKNLDRRPKKIFQTEQSAKIEGLAEIMQILSQEISNLCGCTVEELNHSQYVMIAAIIDEL